VPLHLVPPLHTIHHRFHRAGWFRRPGRGATLTAVPHPVEGTGGGATAAGDAWECGRGVQGVPYAPVAGGWRRRWWGTCGRPTDSTAALGVRRRPKRRVGLRSAQRLRYSGGSDLRGGRRRCRRDQPIDARGGCAERGGLAATRGTATARDGTGCTRSPRVSHIERLGHESLSCFW